MSYFAEVIDGIVQRVIVAYQDFIDTGMVGDPASWIETSYNTKGGIHLTGGAPLRKNYASPGYTYDPARDAFIAPKPYPSWILDEGMCQWFAPVLLPTDMVSRRWDEATLSWVEFT